MPFQVVELRTRCRRQGDRPQGHSLSLSAAPRCSRNHREAHHETSETTLRGRARLLVGDCQRRKNSGQIHHRGRVIFAERNPTTRGHLLQLLLSFTPIIFRVGELASYALAPTGGNKLDRRTGFNQGRQGLWQVSRLRGDQPLSSLQSLWCRKPTAPCIDPSLRTLSNSRPVRLPTIRPRSLVMNNEPSFRVVYP